MAMAVWGLFHLAADLPVNGYELRLGEPLSAQQAESLSRTAGERDLDLALWKEEPVALSTPLGRSSTARCVSVYGNPSLCFPVGLLCGTMPGAGQTGGCAISAGLADALFGSREVEGLSLTAAGKTLRITGVLKGEELFLVCPQATCSDAGYFALSLNLRHADDPRGTVRSLLQSAGLSEQDTTLLPTGTLRQILTAAAWLPLALVALMLARQMWILIFPAGKGRRTAGFALLILAALALPGVLAGVPRWLIPSRWSELSFWTDLSNAARQSLLAFVSLPDTMRDHLLGRQILLTLACLLGLCSAALLLSLADGVSAKPKEKSKNPAPEAT